MGMKGDQYRGTTNLCGQVIQAPDDCTVSNMHTIERTNCYYR